MIILYLTRGENSPKVCLSLPATPESEAEAFGKLDDFSLDINLTRMEVAASSVQSLVRYIKPFDINGTDYEKLKVLAERLEGMPQREQQIFSGALDAESINCLDDILRVADSLDKYELIEEVYTNRELGGYLVENGLLDVNFPKEVRPYLDYVSIGADYYSSHGGTYTMNGYVKRKEETQALEAGRETVLILRLCSHGGIYQDELSLPASDEVISASMRKLKVTDMDDVLVTVLDSPIPGLAEALPRDGISLGYAIEMGGALEEISQTRCEMDTFFAALEASEPDSFGEALNIAIDLDDYELVDHSEYEYGRAALERPGADLELLDAIDGYMDYGRSCCPRWKNTANSNSAVVSTSCEASTCPSRPAVSRVRRCECSTETTCPPRGRPVGRTCAKGMDDVLITKLDSPIPGLAEALPRDGISLEQAERG